MGKYTVYDSHEREYPFSSDDDIGDKWSLIYNIESLEQFGQWLVSGGYKENSNYKK